MAAVLLAFPDDEGLAAEVAARLGARVETVAWRHFPDKESLVRIPCDVDGADVVLFASLDDPDRKTLPLYYAAATARELGARRIGLVAPYLGYMRQDTRFNPGEAVGARLFLRFLAANVDWLVTVDPHLHRIARLGEVFDGECTQVSAAPLLADWIRRNVPNPFLLGPDAESAQWVARVAAPLQAPWGVLEKVRSGDREVQVGIPDATAMMGRAPVLVDDIASSGGTLAAAVARLVQLRSPPAACVVVHPVFAPGAWEALQSAGPIRVVSTNSIVHHSNAISLAEPLATAIATHLAASVSAR